MALNGCFDSDKQRQQCLVAVIMSFASSILLKRTVNLRPYLTHLDDCDLEKSHSVITITCKSLNHFRDI